MSAATFCAQCAKFLPACDGPESYMSWCGKACSAAWDLANPEEAAKWTKVEDLTTEQRALLDASLGIHKGNA